MISTFAIQTRAVVSTPYLVLAKRSVRFIEKCNSHRKQPLFSERRFRILTRAEAGNESERDPDSTDYQAPSDEPTFVGKLFGSYLQLAVWIVTLSFAGYKGIQLAQTDPSSVGLLIAPPAGALFLIVTFLFYRFSGKKK